MAFEIVCGTVAAVLITFCFLWKKFSHARVTFPEQYSHDFERPIAPVENFWRIAHDSNGSYITAIAMVLRSKKPLEAAVVQKSMELLMKRHPMLRMCIRKNQDGDSCLQKMENVQVDLRQLDAKDWKNAMEESLLEQFDSESGPLWRVTYLPNAKYEPQTLGVVCDMTSHPHECVCIFNFHHIIIDGASCSRMFAEFINYVSKLNRNEEPEVVSMPMLPPVDVYIREVIPLKWYHYLMRAVLELLCIMPGFIPIMRATMGNGNAFTRKYGVEIKRNPQIQPRTKIIPVEFAKEETSLLLKKCKQYQTTVQGAVQTAAGVAMITMLEEQEYEVESNLSVNARPFFKSKVPNDYAGPYIGGMQCKNTFVASPDVITFWSMAKNASEDIHAKLKKNEPVYMLLKLYCMLPMFMAMAQGNKGETSGHRSRQLLVFNNLGNCRFLDASPDDDVIVRARFGCSAEHQHGTIFGNNIATFNGQLFWLFIYFSNITSDATAQKYADLVKGTMLKAIKESPTT